MRKIIIFLVLMLAITCVSAQDCADTDNGPLNRNSPDDYSLGTKAKVTQGIFGNTREDACVSSEDDDTAVTEPSGYYLREFYCKNNKREFEIYTCSDYGFTSCVDGACIGKNGSLSNQSQQSTAPENLCGNEIIDAGEQCDPPFDVCFGADMSEYGECDINCRCILANVESTKCGNGVIDSGETCEQNSDCEIDEICKKCVCIQNPAIIQADTEEEINETLEENQTEEEEKEDKYPLPEVPELNLTAKNLTEMPGISFTQKIANFFKSIWKGIIGIFS